MICRGCHWRTTTSSKSRRSWKAKGINSLCAGKIGQTSTTLGWTRRTSWRSHEWFLHAVEEQCHHGGIPVQSTQSFQEPFALPVTAEGTGMESGNEQDLVAGSALKDEFIFNGSNLWILSMASSLRNWFMSDRVIFKSLTRIESSVSIWYEVAICGTEWSSHLRLAVQ